MRNVRPAALVVALVAAAAVPGAARAEPPAKVGACAETVIVSIGTRFGPRLVKPKNGEPGEGSSVALKNGVYGISYAYVEALGNSKVGDRVMTCLTSIPKGCPKGDDRGRFYTTTNLRTQESWSLPDSQHMCGGA